MVARITLSSIRDIYIKLLARVGSIDGVVLAIGIGSLILGSLVDVFLIRLVCLFLIIGSATLLFFSLRMKHFDDESRVENANSPIPATLEGSGMKKLYFDDFEITPVGKPVEEASDAPSVIPQSDGEVMMYAPAPMDTMLQNLPVMHPEVKTIVRDFQVSDFFDLDSDMFKGDTEPRTEFDFLLNKVLAVLKEVIFGHSVAFFWANREKGQLVLEARATESSTFVSTRRFPMGHDLLSKVAESGKPELITEVNSLSESELLPYYSEPWGVKSFAAVPVYFSRLSGRQGIDRPVGVLAIDSIAEDVFGPETLSLLGQFTKLISALIKSYTDKYDLLLESELLRALRRMQDRVRQDLSITTIVHALGEESSKLLSWDFQSVVLYDETKRAWITKKVTNRAHEGYVLPGQDIDLATSVVGRSIKSNEHTLIDDVEKMTMPRYHADEKISATGSFLSIPISSMNKCYGALNLESRHKANYARQDIELLSRLTEWAAYTLESVYMNDIIREYVIIDEATGVYSKKFFMHKLQEEMQRAEDIGSELSLLFITLDNSTDLGHRFGQEGFERVMLTLAQAVRTSIRPYDMVGRCDRDCFGVILINTPANDSYLWAEKIRRNVAANVIHIEGKSFSITISAGVCGALDGMRIEELIGNTTTVLNKATEDGGNAVRVF